MARRSPTDLLRLSYRVGAAVDALAFVGMALPDRFGASARFAPWFDVRRPEFRYGMRYGAPLMAGWTVLLLWADRDPVERRGVLPITMAPVIAGLMTHDAQAVSRGEARRPPVIATRALQVGLLGLFGLSYARASTAARSAG
jgi:hypothetical protein